MDKVCEKNELMYSKLSQSDNLLGNPRLQPWGTWISQRAVWQRHTLACASVYRVWLRHTVISVLNFPTAEAGGYLKDCGSATAELLVAFVEISSFGQKSKSRGMESRSDSRM